MRRKIGDAVAGETFTLKQDVGKYTPYYYAGASGDYNLIHIDPEFGKMVGLGGNILHGLCTMAFTARAMYEWADDPGALKQLRVRFSSPVKPEDTVTVQAKVAGVEGAKATVEFNAVNQNGEEVISMATAELELAE